MPLRTRRPVPPLPPPASTPPWWRPRVRRRRLFRPASQPGPWRRGGWRGVGRCLAGRWICRFVRSGLARNVRHFLRAAADERHAGSERRRRRRLLCHRALDRLLCAGRRCGADPKGQCQSKKTAQKNTAGEAPAHDPTPIWLAIPRQPVIDEKQTKVARNFVFPQANKQARRFIHSFGVKGAVLNGY